MANALISSIIGESISLRLPDTKYSGVLTAIIYYAPAPKIVFKTPPDEFKICKVTNDFN